MTTLESLARTIAKARHGTDAMWANYMESAKAVEKMMSGWQPIETAPKDRSILVYNPMVGPYQSAYQAVAGIDDEWPCFLWGERPGTWYPIPTHWMELPERPK